MTLNLLNESSFEIGGYTITLDYAIGGSKLKSSGRNFTIMEAPSFFVHYAVLDLCEDTALRPSIQNVHVERELIKIRKSQNAGERSSPATPGAGEL